MERRKGRRSYFCSSNYKALRTPVYSIDLTNFICFYGGNRFYAARKEYQQKYHFS